MASTQRCPNGRIRRAQTRDGITVGHYRLDPDYRLGAHEHRGASLAVGLRGRYVATVHGREHRLEAGQALVYPAGARHREWTGPSGSECLLISFGDRRVPDGSRRLFDDDRLVQRPTLAHLGTMVIAELAAGDAATPVGLEALVADLVGEVDDDTGMPPEPRRPHWVHELREELDARLDSPPALVELAKLFGRTREHLARSFRSAFGESIGQYLRRRRLDHAARHLTTTDRSLATIALDAGFADQSHFTRWFRRRYGITPATYRSARRDHHRPA